MTKRRLSFAAAAAVLLFLAAYANSFRNAFHFDDAHVIQNNPWIRDLANIPRFFTDANTFSSLPQNTTYRPLLSVSLAIDYAIARGLNPIPYHVQQLLLFAALGVLIFLFYRRVLQTTPLAASQPATIGWVALFAATLFCVHTGNTQPGNYISARSELLSAIGVLGAFAMYIHVPRSHRFHLYLVPAILGMLAKNHAIMFAPLLLLYKLLFEFALSFRQTLTQRHCPDRTRALIFSIPAFVVLGSLLVFIEAMPSDAQNYGGGSRWAYLATSTWVWVRYVGLYFLPIGLTADTDLQLFQGFDARILAGIAVLAASLVIAWRASNNASTRPIAFGILWFWIAIAPTSTIFPLAEVTNDHRYFIGFIGLNLAVLWALVLLVAGSRSLHRYVPYAAAGLLIAHAVGTHVRNRVWRSDETLWSDVVEKSPKNGRGLMNYGLTLMRRGQLTEARDLYVRAQEFNPNYSYLEVNLGIVNAALGDHVEAEKHFQRAVQLDVRQPVVHRYFARWLMERGRGVEAMGRLQSLAGSAPSDVEARRELTAIYAALGLDAPMRDRAREILAVLRDDAAARAYSEGRLPFTPASNDSQGWFDLGLSFTRANQHLDAAQAYRAAVSLNPANVDALNNLGWTLGKLGFFSDAVDPLERAVRLKPGYTLARNNLAWVRGEVRQGHGVRRT